MTGFLLGPADLAVRAEHGPVVVLDATVTLAKPSRDGDHDSTTGLAGWQEAHIPGSRHADLLHDLSDPSAGFHFARPAAGVLAARLAALGVRDGVPVVVYDRAGGIWATRLWWLLDWIGVEAYVLDGGLSAWQAAGMAVGFASDINEISDLSGGSGALPVSEGPVSEGSVSEGPVSEGPVSEGPVREGPVSAGSVREGRWVERGDLEAWLGGDVRASVVCALDPASYSGEVPTRYSRRGHIPGTGNVPARSLLDADGRFLPAAELREILDHLLGDPDPIWVYCGGGISATTLGFVLRELGREDVRIYDGSLEEWSADPSLPLELGHGLLGPEVRELIDRPEFGVLSTAEPDGSAQLSVMWVGRDGDDLVMATRTGRRKVRNIARDPRVTVLFHDRRKPARYAEVRGTARVTGEDAHALVDELARRYTGAAHVVTDPAAEADRVVVRITPSKVLYR
ncbi:hypothetical protein ACTI_39400 [Actinoplanes sp. OR16]|uniref:TIGR03618 family F420-dependent PPOX class oxidoreductase n=1 Tax=Actinoplanes sp. OR16 TaxID=946334 RepID=UPI000F702034|nr:TIGR03618 family F420-dependent PPOX class oxidoreductase [Actinoplanes sp. OR16]BBH67255.1 hypothetical protein ACTI_39400 [Actinoplanes sp. OR16]